MFLEALRDAPLPRGTMVRLMQHYERLGEFGKAEDALYTILDAEPEEPAILGFGMSFYQRLSSQSDSSLVAGNLPREELEAGLAEIERRSTRRPHS